MAKPEAEPLTAKKALDITDLNNVITCLEEKFFPNDQWNRLGLVIGIIYTDLKTIRAEYNNPNDCLRECLALWLQQKYDTKKYGLPSMESLANAAQTMGLRAVSSGILESFPKVLQSQAKETTTHCVEPDISQSLKELQTKFATLVANMRKRLADHIKNQKIELIDIARFVEEYLIIGGLTNVESIDGLFNRIQDHYYFLNCSVIECLATTFLIKEEDNQLQEKIRDYLRKLESFKSTKLTELQSHHTVSDDTSHTSIKVILKFNSQWQNQTIKVLELFLSHYFDRSDLFNYIQIDQEFVCITFLIPHSLSQYLIDVAKPKLKSMHRVGVLQLVINNDALLDEKDGISIDESLVEAVKSGDTFEVAMLLLLGANSHYKDSNGDSPMSLALSGGNEKVKKLMPPAEEFDYEPENSIGSSKVACENITDDDTRRSKVLSSAPATVNNERSTPIGLKPDSSEENLIDVSKLGDEVMATMKRVLIGNHVADISIMIVGRTGQGKSTLVNSIIEKKVAKEGAHAQNCTTTTQTYYYPNVVPGITIRIIDIPGLQDTHGKEGSHIQGMRNCQDVNLILFCKKMTDHRLTNDDKIAIQKLHQAFGPKFWERVVFVLTFANKENCEDWDDRDEDDEDQQPKEDDDKGWTKLKKDRFVHRVDLQEQELTQLVNSNLELDISTFPVIPAGRHKRERRGDDPMELPDRDNWLHDLLQLCYSQIKTEFTFSKLRLNDKIDLAVIIDNRAELGIEEDGTRKLSDDVATLKKAFEGHGFCVLYFNNLSSHSLVSLLNNLRMTIEDSQLSLFALTFLGKKETSHFYDVNGKDISFIKLFHPFTHKLRERNMLLPSTPKLFFFCTDDEECSSLHEAHCPQNSLVLAAACNNLELTRFVNLFVEKFSIATDLIKRFQVIRTEYKNLGATCISYETISSRHTLFFHQSINNENTVLEKQIEVLHSLWLPVRYHTIDVIIKNKDEVVKIASESKIEPSVLVSGGAVAAAGLTLAPFTSGASLALAAALTAGGVTGVAYSIYQRIQAEIKSIKHLNEAQQLINFDQQLSITLNNAVSKYKKKNKHSPLSGVTVPHHIGLISFQVLQAFRDKIDHNEATQWVFGQTEKMLKGTCNIIDTTEYKAGEVDNRQCGYKISIQHSEVPITVRTIISGQFKVPEGYTLVSAVYELEMEKKLKGPVTITVEHCVNVSSQSVIEKMCFATAATITKLGERHKFVFVPVNNGHIDDTHGSITCDKSCFLCILYEGSLQDTSVKYGVLSSYTKKSKNFWTMNLIIMKNLKAHFKYVESQVKVIDGQVRSDPTRKDFAFKKESRNTPLALKLKNAKATRTINGWTIAPYKEISDVTKETIDTIEIHPEKVWKLQSGVFPSISLNVYVSDFQNAAESVEESIEFEGTDLKVSIYRHKE